MRIEPALSVALRRIDKDLRIFRKLGLTEEQVLKTQHLCTTAEREKPPDNVTECHIRQGFHQRVAPRFLVSGGNVFLTHVTPSCEPPARLCGPPARPHWGTAPSPPTCCVLLSPGCGAQPVRSAARRLASCWTCTKSPASTSEWVACCCRTAASSMQAHRQREEASKRVLPLPGCARCSLPDAEFAYYNQVRRRRGVQSVDVGLAQRGSGCVRAELYIWWSHLLASR